MKEYKNKKRVKNFFSSKIWRILMLIILLIMVFPVFRVYLKSKEANKMSDGVGQELAELQAKKEFLTTEIARLKTEIGKEEEARKKFNIGKPEEELLIITEKKGASTSEEMEGEGFLGGFWQKFKSIF